MAPQADATEPTTVSHAACRSAWARLIAKVYEIELSGGSCREADSGSPLHCPRCGSEMRLIAVITDRQGGSLHRPVKIGRSPPGLDPGALN
jgi:hypothetical protein